MKKLLCTLVALCLMGYCALAETDEAFTLRFEDGFSLELPTDWVSYPVSDADAAGGVEAILGDEEANRLLIVERQTADGLDDYEALKAAIEARDDCGAPQDLALNGQTFATFIMPDDNISGCATLLDGGVLVFLFTPQDDSEYMAQVASFMGSFKLL